MSGRKSNADAIFGSPKPICKALHVQANHNYSASYFDLLRNHLRSPSKWKHCGLLSTTTHLQHGNIRPYTAHDTAETFFDIHLWAPPSSSYPPELIFSYCHIFEPLKEALGGQTLGSNKEMQEVMHKWPCMWPKEIFSQGFQALIKSWRSWIWEGLCWKWHMCTAPIHTKLTGKRLLRFHLAHPYKWHIISSEKSNTYSVTFFWCFSLWYCQYLTLYSIDWRDNWLVNEETESI